MKIKYKFLMGVIFLLFFIEITSAEEVEDKTILITEEKTSVPSINVRELVDAVVLDKYARYLNWSVRPENYKELCNNPDPVLREQCQIDILEYIEMEIPFVKLKIKYLEGVKMGNEEIVDCMFYTGKGMGVYIKRGINPYEDEDYVKTKLDDSYKGIYHIKKQTKMWNKFKELGDEYCEFELKEEGLITNLLGIGHKGGSFEKILIWIENFLEAYK